MSRKARLKKIALSGRDTVLGFDETNNGFGLLCPNLYHKTSLIVTAYKGNNRLKGKDYIGSTYENKGRVFNGYSRIEDVLKKGTCFLDENPDFLYTSISKEDIASTPLGILRARAIAVLAMAFILRYDLDSQKIQIISDEIDGRENSRKIGDILRMYLEKSGLGMPFRFIKGAEHTIIPVRKADRAGYYLTAIHFLGSYHKWPFRARKINHNSLESLTLQMLDRNQADYEP